VSFAYLPILLGGLFVASKYTRVFIEFCLTASVFNLFVDLVIDPAAVHIGFWKYSSGGVYYGVPFSNFIGWLLTGFLYAAFFYLVVDDEKYPLPDGFSVSLIWILCFWTGYLVFNGLYVPALIGGILVSYLVKSIKLI
ncbi:carotenoid biosynthesis protein, partial [Candidatus Bathyarchaeota archaeon]|nr:carotenoid biosynthesis protein [Candidatus Bathyarchaeota archaeon]